MNREWINAKNFKDGVLNFIDRHFQEINKSYPINKFRFNYYQSCLLSYYEDCDTSSQMNEEDYKKFKERYEEYKNVWKDACDKAESFYLQDLNVIRSTIVDDFDFLFEMFINPNEIDGIDVKYFFLMLNLIDKCYDDEKCDIGYVKKWEYLLGFLKDEYDAVEMCKNYYLLRILENTDRLIALSRKLSMPSDANFKPYKKNGKKLVYFDTNVFINIEESENKASFMKILEKSKSRFNYYYSPSNLEDVQKRKSLEFTVDNILDIINEITDSLFIHRVDEGVRLDYESIETSNARVCNDISLQVTNLVEEYRIIYRKMKELDFPEYCSDEFKNRANNLDLFNADQLLLKKVLRKLNSSVCIEEIKYDTKKDIKNKKYEEINCIFYDLIKAMDVLHFYSDKLRNEKKIRSSVHDVEHIIYALYADCFVTDDKKLYERAKTIFGYVAPHITVLKINELAEYIER